MASYLYFGILSTLFHLVLSSVRFLGNPQQVSLYGKPYEQGYVEILNRGAWKRLAAAFFDDNDANVICKMMGYTTGGQHIPQNQLPRRDAGMYAILGSLACNGHEKSIESCPRYSPSHNPWLQSVGFFPIVVRCSTVWTCAAHRCPSQSSCYMKHDRPTCRCSSGFTYKALRNVCEDVNECTGSNQCSRNANCYNTLGSYVCRCKSGFEGNGRVCANKCNLYCPSRSVCIIWNGEPRCKCNSGYVRKGNSCISRNQEDSNDGRGSNKGKQGDVKQAHVIIGVILSGVIAIVLLFFIFYKAHTRHLLRRASAHRTNTISDDPANNGATNVFVITGSTEFSNTSPPSNDLGFDQLPNYFTLYPESITDSGASQLGQVPSYYEAVNGGGNQYVTLTTLNHGDSEAQNETGTNADNYNSMAYENQGPPPAYEDISYVH